MATLSVVATIAKVNLGAPWIWILPDSGVYKNKSRTTAATTPNDKIGRWLFAALPMRNMFPMICEGKDAMIKPTLIVASATIKNTAE